MKSNKILLIVAVLTAGFCARDIAHAQTYFFSTPVTGSVAMAVHDNIGGGSNSFNLNLNNLTEYVYYNSAAQTVEEVGTISYAPSAPNITIQEISGGVQGNITVTLAPTGGVLTFDTGPQPILAGSRIDAAIYNIQSQINGTYSLVTGGQTLNGSFAYNLSYSSVDAPHTYNGFSTTGYPGSVQLSMLDNSGFFGPYASNPGIVADVTASNGFHMQLSPDAFWNWSANNLNVTAILVPEPAFPAFLGLGMTALAILRRRAPQSPV